MNPEAMRPVPKRMITHPETLGKVCWNLANGLTHKRWILDAVRSTDLTRSISEQIGFETYVGDTEVMATINDIHVGFFASKEVVDGYNGNPMDIENYQLTMSVSQSINQSEVPRNVLDEIFDSANDYHDDDDDHDEYESILDEVNRDNLDEFEIVREQEIIYNISGGGEIKTYELAYTYSIEDEQVHDVTYSSEYGQRIMMPMTLAGTGEEVDKRPVTQLRLTNEQFDRELKDVKDMDASWLRYIQEASLKEIVSFGAQDQQQHRRQALAMIGLIGSGMYSLKRLAGEK
ncbi:hypothetical protein H7100_03390 [Candidatus Saccharibacteria bacterium]|nr:hypothetical protein [Candidatus Saccharibacteria bacterium]